MNTLAQKAVAATEHCEVRKIAYRQSKDGIVVSFVIHPNEVPERLAMAALGARYLLTVTELGDNDEPVTTEPRQPVDDTSRPAGGRAKRNWRDIARSQQAAIALNNDLFRIYLDTEIDPVGCVDTASVESADKHLKKHLGIESKTELDKDETLGQAWDDFWRGFKAWEHEPEHMGT